MARQDAPPARHVFHGTTADPLDILLHGLETREDHEGISVTTKIDRAVDWAALKRGDVWVVRIPTRVLSKLIPENAYPADPRYDFTTDSIINPMFLEEQHGRKWQTLMDIYSHLLDEGELKEWRRKWLKE